MGSKKMLQCYYTITVCFGFNIQFCHLRQNPTACSEGRIPAIQNNNTIDAYYMRKCQCSDYRIT